MKLSKSFLKEKLFPDFLTSLRLSEDFSDMDAC
ncbi:BnaC02g35310D, partial [Brassica napus]